MEAWKDIALAFQRTVVPERIPPSCPEFPPEHRLEVAVVFTSPENNVSLEAGGNNLMAEQITQPCAYLSQNNLTPNDLVFFGDKETGKKSFSC